MDTIAVFILFLHGGAFLAGLAKAPLDMNGKNILLSLLAILFSMLFLDALSQSRDSIEGSFSVWYLILSLVTIGFIPFLTLGASLFSGRFFMSVAYKAVR